MSSIDVSELRATVSLAQQVVDSAVAAGAARTGQTDEQVIDYDLAHAAAALQAARVMTDYATSGPAEAALSAAFVADVVHDLMGKIVGREALWGCTPVELDRALPTVGKYRNPTFIASLAGLTSRRGLDDEFQMVESTFRRFAEDKVRPARRAGAPPLTPMCPKRLSRGWRRSAASACQSPSSSAASPPADQTTTWRWWSPPKSCRVRRLGIGGSLITRPEILTRALDARRYRGADATSGCPASPRGDASCSHRRDRARLRLGCGRRARQRHTARRRLRHQWHEDVVHVRRREPTC